jgi:pimeloyl-ACP methyl ester carboxylesterase
VGLRRGAIQVPTSLWYGRADTLVPGAHGDWLASRIPGVEVFASEYGHFGGDDDEELQLRWMAGH